MTPTVVPPAAMAELAAKIARESERAGLDPKIAAAVIMAESSFNAKPVSDEGKVGLMQIHPDRAPAMAAEAGLAYGGADALKNPNFNIELGLAALAGAMRAHQGDFTAALLAYNLGAGAAADIGAGTRQITPLTARYLHNVKRYMKAWGAALPDGWSFVLNNVPEPTGTILQNKRPAAAPEPR